MKGNDLLRAPPPDPEEAIKAFWASLEEGGDAGCTTWEVLDPIRDKVTECLAQSPPDIARASRLTALAIALTEGESQC